jgi:hypothetical protein
MPAFLRSLARTAAPGLLFFLAACRPSPVALVNGQAISRAELDAQVSVFQSMRPGVADDEALRRQVLDQMIKRALLEQAARREGLAQDPAIRAEVAARRGQSRARLEQAIRDAQGQLQGVDAAVEQQVLVEAWSRRRRAGMTVTAKDLQDAYSLRARTQALPPFPAVRDQLMEQVILDRLVEQERPRADVQVLDKAPR